MSYLLDALRKAEKERNLGRVPDLDSLSHSTAAGAGKSLPVWVLAVVGMLVAVNLVVIVAFWWYTGQHKQPFVSSHSEPARQAAGSEASAPANQALPEQTVTASPDTGQPPAPADYQGVGQQGNNNAGPDNTVSGNTIPGDAITDNYGEPPLVSREEKIPEYRALPARQRAQIPNLQVNGHLYSSIPGRSFVLINGRRYHEGQRLAEGPAVVLIDKAGAIFKYGDIRFRLDAPR